jgi:hypothetical protein
MLVAGVLVGLNLESLTDLARAARERYYRHRLYAALRPEPLANCSWARFGHPNDGGYLMCDNLLTGVSTAYSYGIEGRDEWGCAIAQKTGAPVHQYDCFVTAKPSCAGASFIFHEECVGQTGRDSGNRVFDTLANHIARNGDQGKRLVVKMDVEGAEWDVLMGAPEGVLANIQQLVVEFHEVDQPRFSKVIERLKRTFVVANVHFNNFTCNKDVGPLPAYAFEVLFVNRSIAQVSEAGAGPITPNPLDSPNVAGRRDCQANW